MTRDPTPAVWRKSTRSNSQAACVEVRDLPGRTAMRDSKDPAGTVLSFPASAWSAFTAGVRAGQFD